MGLACIANRVKSIPIIRAMKSTHVLSIFWLILSWCRFASRAAEKRAEAAEKDKDKPPPEAAPVSGDKRPTVDNDDEDEAENADEEAMACPVPQVKIGPDGSIVLNEESTVVQTSPPKIVEGSDSELVHENESSITYKSFRRQTYTKKCWTHKGQLREWFRHGLARITRIHQILAQNTTLYSAQWLSAIKTIGTDFRNSTALDSLPRSFIHPLDYPPPSIIRQHLSGPHGGG